MLWLEGAKHLLIWGVAFHEYDAELASVLMSSEPPEGDSRTLTVINPDTVAQHRAIALTNISEQLPVLVSKNILTTGQDFLTRFL